MPVRTKSLRGPQRKRRRAKHGEPLDAIELCRRLEELKRQDRISPQALAYRSPRKKRPVVSSAPYHHVPRTAAKDFTRTTFSQSLPAPDSIMGGLKHGKPPQVFKSSNCGFPRSEAQVCNRCSLVPSQSLERPLSAGVLRYYKTSVSDGSRIERCQSQAWSHSENVYDSLMGTHEGVRRLSTGDVENGHLTNAELELQPGSHALAHKITRHHLDDKTDWTQSDACDNDGKHKLTEWIAPLFRSLARRSDTESGFTPDEVTLTENELQERKVSRRRSSFLFRGFSKG